MEPISETPAPDDASQCTITRQPTTSQDIQHQTPHNYVSNVPYGLEYLNGIEKLIVSQKKEWLEIFTGFETENKYAVFNNSGQKVYYAREISDCCERIWCGPLRSFDINVVDCYNREIQTPDGAVTIGKIKKHWTGALQELFTDADTFALSFPVDLDVKIKAVLFGALFLIDFMYFENNQSANC